MITQDFILYAINVHTGGGKTLLDTLLSTHSNIKILFCDERYTPPENLNIQIVKIKPTLFSRFKAEFKLHQITKKNHLPVLFFGNLPPILKHESQSYLFLQNAFLLKNISIPFDSLKSFLRLSIEKLWLKCFINNIDEIFVQTPWMLTEAQKSFSQIPIKLWPLMPKLESKPLISFNEKKYDFIFIGTRAKNKRLDLTLEALKNFDHSVGASYGVSKKFIFNCILDHLSEEQQAQIKEKYNFKNIIFNIRTQIHRTDLIEFIYQSRFLITTSQVESFNLPVYEGLHLGCVIIAPANTGYLEHLHSKQIVQIDHFLENFSSVILPYYQNN